MLYFKGCGSGGRRNFLEEVRKNLEKNITLNGRHFELKLYAAGLMLENYSGETMTVQSKLEYTLEKARSARNHKLVFFNDIVKTNGGVNLDFMKIIHQSVLDGCDGFYVEYQPIRDIGRWKNRRGGGTGKMEKGTLRGSFSGAVYRLD